jgi:phosphate-selective porin OprO/OprP
VRFRFLDRSGFARRTRIVSVLAAVALAAPSAGAGDSAMLKLLEVLRDNGTLDAAAYQALRDAALADAATPAVSAAAEDDGDVEIRLDRGGLRVSSADDAFEFELGGRVHVDHAVYFGDDEGFGDGAEMRRVRIRWGGQLFRDWGYKGEVDFAGDEVSLKSTYLSYEGLESAVFTVGNFKHPFGLSRLGSSNTMVFMERAAAANLLPPGRDIGVGAALHGDRWNAALGVFRQGENDGDAQNEGWAVTGRGVLRPWQGDQGVLHLGAALSYRRFLGTDTERFRERPETHVSGVRLVDTGDIADLDEQLLYGFELFGTHGPFAVQSEFLRTELMRRGRNLDFQGWYAAASWLLTGESRGYNARKGIFGGVVPRRNLGEGGFGAWEVGLRYSTLNLNSAEIQGGAQEILTVGLNWYVNPNIRFMADFVDVLDSHRSGNPQDGADPMAYQMRAQVNF